MFQFPPLPCKIHVRRLPEQGYYHVFAAKDGEAEGYKYYEYDGSNVEGDSNYRAEEYYAGDRGLGCVYLPDIDKDNVSEGWLDGDWHPPVRRRGQPLFRGRSWARQEEERRYPLLAPSPSPFRE